MRMSIASTNSPSTFLSTPSMPTSAIWCCAQLDEQPAKCRRKSSPWPFGRTCSSRNAAISAARLLGVDLGQAAELLARAGLQRRALKSVGLRGELLQQRLGEQRVDVLVRDPRQQHVLLVGQAQRVVVVRRTRGRGGRARTAARPSGGRPGRRSRPCGARRRPAACTPMWSSPRRSGRLRDAAAQLAADAALELLAAAPRGPIAVDEELQARLAARLRGSPRSRGRSPVIAGDDLGGLLGRDEDVDPAREARLRGEPAADAQVEARACRPRGSRAESAMSLIRPRAQSSRAAGDRDLVLAREVRVELVVEEVLVDRLGGGVAVDDLRRGAMPASVQPTTLRVMSPQAPEVVSPTRSRRAKISGMLSSVIQWIWKHWRVVQSMIPRPKSSAIEAITSAWSALSTPWTTLTRSMKWPSLVLWA